MQPAGEDAGEDGNHDIGHENDHEGGRDQGSGERRNTGKGPAEPDGKREREREDREAEDDGHFPSRRSAWGLSGGKKSLDAGVGTNVLHGGLNQGNRVPPASEVRRTEPCLVIGGGSESLEDGNAGKRILVLLKDLAAKRSGEGVEVFQQGFERIEEGSAPFPSDRVVGEHGDGGIRSRARTGQRRQGIENLHNDILGAKPVAKQWRAMPS